MSESELENILLKDTHILLCIDKHFIDEEFEYIKKNFCGIVFSNMDNFNNHSISPNAIIYLCGNIEQIQNKIIYLQESRMTLKVIKKYSCNYENIIGNYKLIDMGEIPINIHNVGIYFRQLFNPGKNYFDLINNEHQFQELTESNKPSNAFRTGIYLTKIETLPAIQRNTENNEIKFKLLRCSSNLNGPTDNFRKTDNEIINQVNEIAEHFFDKKTEFNHVLAQIYINKIINTDTKQVERKAKIKDHSDKTKDMPRNGLIAFCTFYKFDTELKNIKISNDSYDYCYNETSVLTKLRFRLKNCVDDPILTKKFDVTLYPNSVFIISLLTNRLYTHEIIPSILPIDKIPTRMGYVIRCSKTDAIIKNGKTYIDDDGKYVELEEPNVKDIKKLKDLYFKENTTSDIIHYDKFNFSLNSGDYVKPIV